MRFRFDGKNFFLGVGSVLVAMILPAVGNLFIDLVSRIRDAMPWSKKK